MSHVWAKKKRTKGVTAACRFFLLFLLIEFQSGSWNNFMSKTVTSRKVFLVHLYADAGLHRSEAAQKLSLAQRLLTENQDWTDCKLLARTQCTQCSSPTRRGAGASRTTTTASTPPAIHKKSSKTRQQRALYVEYCFDLTEKSRLFC